MSNTYLNYFESTNRILHIPTYWAEYKKYWNDPQSASTELRLKLLLVIGIGSSIYWSTTYRLAISREDEACEFHKRVHRWVYAAQAWLAGPLEKDRLSVSALQIDCLTVLARQIFSIGADLVWTSMGSLIHKAMQINLHRDPKHLSGISVLQAEVRRRLWATIVEMTVQASLDSAMQPGIPESDTEPPSNLDDAEMDETSKSLPFHPRSTHTLTSMQLLLLDSLPVRLRIVKLLTNLKSEISYLDVIELSSKLTDACCACSTYLKENSELSIPRFNRNLIDYLVRRFMIPLHCLFTTTARENPFFSFSLKASMEAATTILSPEPDMCFDILMAMGGGLFREGIWCAMTVISIELLAQAESQRLDGTLLRNRGYIGFLKQNVSKMLPFATERIRQGETNIKCHMFLEMILAHVNAIETGGDHELSIAEGAKASLEFCLGILQKRAEQGSLASPMDISLPSGGPDDGLGESGSLFDLGLDWDFLLPDAGLA
ncbi:hypothetical protein N7532_007293 [Penicillium argentinense]|uniref:Xylanolytic transcriptional activator regulatory domain-containing protein n=1 Tax=Penicillium argentinense TaxID=1131581 RepID=A0A9W9F7N1_9EURO|nr:uncharacterized protein N7532_007293 [Penicillium argentinense]KAJ5095002.1 hypothetical protein N7532_007293 [Penicillium argentinense]